MPPLLGTSGRLWVEMSYFIYHRPQYTATNCDEQTVTMYKGCTWRTVWQMSQEEGDCPAKWHRVAAHCSSVHGKDSELLPHPPYSLDLAALVLLSVHVCKYVASTVWPMKQSRKRPIVAYELVKWARGSLDFWKCVKNVLMRIRILYKMWLQCAYVTDSFVPLLYHIGKLICLWL